jgi:membrane-associated phospholipid phosphatase
VEQRAKVFWFFFSRKNCFLPAMRFLTDFADLATVLPIAVCAGLALAWVSWWRGAVAWSCSILFALAAILALKLAFLACTGFSPSGHTAAGTAVWGGIFALILRRWLSTPAACLLAGGSVAALIGYSRVALHAHDIREVATGAGVGLVAIAGLLAAIGPTPPGLRPRALMFPSLLVIIPLHGLRVPAEPMVRHAATWLAPRLCPARPRGPSPAPTAATTMKS